MAAHTSPTINSSALNDIDCFDSAEAVEAARQQVDRQIQDLENGIRSLKGRRNNLAITARLPPELLAKIFTFCAAEAYSTTVYPSRWIKITHTCNHWREVALACPDLWSYIVLGSPQWATEMLARSKSAPIAVKYLGAHTHAASGLHEALTEALGQITRITELSLHGHLDNISTVLSRSPAPLLQYFRFESTGWQKLPADLFQGIAPRLCHLELKRCSIPWDSLMLSKLTTLSLHMMQTDLRPPIEEIVSALRKMPLLAHLDLSDVIPDTALPVSSASDGSVVHLPRLQKLTIAARGAQCAVLLSQLKYPQNITATLSCETLYGIAVGNAASDLSALFPLLPSFTQQSITSLSITHSVHQGLDISGFTTSKSPRFSIRFPQTRSCGVVDRVCRQIPLRDLRDLTIKDVSVDPLTYRRCFGLAPRLQTIQLDIDDPSHFVQIFSMEIPLTTKQRAAAPVPDGGNTSQTTPTRKPPQLAHPWLYFPILQTLTLKNTQFDDREGVHAIGDRHLKVDVLLDALIARCNYGFDLWNLHLKECRQIGDDDVKDIENIVSNTQWDGLELGFTDTEEEEDSFEDEDEEGYYDSDNEYHYHRYSSAYDFY